MKRQHALMVGARMPLLITLFADYYDASYNNLFDVRQNFAKYEK